MMKDRLVLFIKKNKLSSFLKHRSTVDHLIRIETFIREAFIRKQHVFSIFYDLERAFDTTRKYGVMNDLYHLVIRGRLAYFISAFSNEHQFKVRGGGAFV